MELPIHLACRSQKSPNRSIGLLYEAYPEGIVQENKHGQTPIDVARTCPMNDRKRQARIELLKSLMNDYKQKIKSLTADCCLDTQTCFSEVSLSSNSYESDSLCGVGTSTFHSEVTIISSSDTNDLLYSTNSNHILHKSQKRKRGYGIHINNKKYCGREEEQCAYILLSMQFACKL